MVRRRKGERARGPYPDARGRRRVIQYLDAAGEIETVTYESEAAATRERDEFNAQANQVELTTDGARDAYERHLEVAGNKPTSIQQTMWAIRSFFPTPIELWEITHRRCKRLYLDLVARPLDRTGRPPSVASHRGVLSQVKTFLDYCAEQGWIRGTPAKDVRGVGRRKARKKQLRHGDARRLYQHALFAADWGDEGAVAVLVALELGKRASDIVRLRVGDVQGDVVYVDESKTEESEGAVRCSEDLARLLAEQGEGKRRGDPLFRAHSQSGLHDRDWVRAQVARMCHAAGVPVVTAHGLRGTLATQAIDAGLDGEAVARLLGHRDVRTTRASYAEPGAGGEVTRRRRLTLLRGGKA